MKQLNKLQTVLFLAGGFIMTVVAIDGTTQFHD